MASKFFKGGKYVFDMLVPKPKVPKTKSEKQISELRSTLRKERSKSTKKHQDEMNKILKEGAYWRRRLQKARGEKITKSGVSKSKDTK
mgnify:FL=1